MDMSFTFSNTSFMDLAPSQEFEDVKRSFIEAPGTLSPGTLLGSPAHNMRFDSQEDWVLVPEQTQSQTMRLPFFGMDTMMPASGDLPSALGVTPFYPQLNVANHGAEQESPCNRQWYTQRYEQQVSYENLVSTQYAVDPNAACDCCEHDLTWSTTAKGSWISTASVDSCIVPTEMDIVDTGIHTPLYGVPIRNDRDVPSSPCGRFQSSIAGRSLLVKQELSQPDSQEELSPVKSDLSASLRSSLCTQSGRGIRKEKRLSTRSKRKARNDVTEVYRGSTYDVHRVHQDKKKSKYKCKLKKADGRECERQFDRVEHLRRHEHTHSGEKPFICVISLMRNEKDEEITCGTRFSRRDNLRDHYKTHLSQTKAGRNGRIGFEKFYQILREKEELDEAEKTITMLEKWRAAGKNLKDEEQVRSRL